MGDFKEPNKPPKPRPTKPMISVPEVEWNKLNEKVLVFQKNMDYWEKEYKILSKEYDALYHIKPLIPLIKTFVDDLANHQYKTLLELQEHIDDSIDPLLTSLSRLSNTGEDKWRQGLTTLQTAQATEILNLNAVDFFDNQRGTTILNTDDPF